MSSLANAVVIQPNTNPLVLSRLHRWSMGQSVTFFDNDFAGRIAQKADADRSCDHGRHDGDDQHSHVCTCDPDRVGHPVDDDQWLDRVCSVTLADPLFCIDPLVHRRAFVSGRLIAQVHAQWFSGQVVDTITNIKTVKLFAHADHEDRAALGAMDVYSRQCRCLWANVCSVPNFTYDAGWGFGRFS